VLHDGIVVVWTFLCEGGFNKAPLFLTFHTFVAVAFVDTSLRKVTSATSEGGTLPQVARRLWKRGGLRGIYRGSGAVAMRQATNWASRQGFTELARPLIKFSGAGGEVLAGVAGGLLATWNTPFEVARVEMQATLTTASNDGPSMAKRPSVGSSREAEPTLFGTLASLRRERGLSSLFSGLGPRIGQGCYMTVFMIVVPKLMDGLPK
jgi:hypothetical protein